jgi:glycosyltransferase involved in cell wall biosynthesis
LINSSKYEINNFFNYKEKETETETETETDILVNINNYDYNENEVMSINNFKKGIFLCLEVPKLFHKELTNYITANQLKSIYLLHDIIPLKLQDEVYKTQDYYIAYFNNNILHTNKLITNSEFTKTEFLKYCENNNIKNVPPIKSVLLPYQYRNKERVLKNKNKNIKTLNSNSSNSKISILLPGTIEPRKQQLLFMELFNNFIKNNPTIDIELIAFGHLSYDIRLINEQINISKGKIKYLGVIDNEKLCDLYKNATFTCFISKYEGYGFPIAESLWHGTPVLTSCFGSMYEIATRGGCYCIDTTNPNAIYHGLDTLVKNPRLLKKLREELDNSSLPSWENYTDKILLEIFKDI